MKQKSRLNFSGYSLSRQKQQKKQLVVAVSFGLCALLIGLPMLDAKYGRGLAQRTIACLWPKKSRQSTGYKSNTTVFALALTPPEKRAKELEAIANGDKSRENARARYLLASDLLQQQQAQKALDLLEGLECEYSPLAAHISHKRAQAYQLMGDKALAAAEWQNLLKYYPDSAVVPEALLGLGKKKEEDWKSTIAKYPSHPRTLEMVSTWLDRNPDRRDLMLLLARYGFEQPGISVVLDKLVSQPTSIDGKPLDPIKPEDWEAIAKGYWNERKYSQASAAYAKASPTPRNAYLVARGLQLAQKETDANIAYKKMVEDFPKAQETASALLQIADIEPSIEAVTYLDRTIGQFPDRAGEALLEKAKALDHLSNSQAADEARQLLLTKYGNSDAAAEYRWDMAQASADAGNVQTALQWAQPILTENSNSDRARQAGFWVGKWATRLGQSEEAKVAFEKVLQKYPYSYYAWRSAVSLGWDVGDFNTLRQIKPEVALPTERSELPSGSNALKELYRLNQNQDAWTLWQAEFQNPIQPTVTEQFTDGLLRLATGDYLSAITEISTLEDRDTSSEQKEYQAVKQKPLYWYASYPLPSFEVIQTWAQKRQINPLLVVAVIRQESRFMPKIRSHAGAVGLMQVMPDIAKVVADKIDLDRYNLENPRDNVNFGTWLLDENHQLYKNSSLLAVASYNAGSGNVTQWIKEKNFTDPDEFVENIPFIETRDYVKQVFGNYWNYLRLYNPKVNQMVKSKLASLDSH